MLDIKKAYRYISYCVPSAIILSLGMLALYSALIMIDVQRNFSQEVTRYSGDFIKMQDAYFEYVRGFDQLSFGEKQVQPENVADKFGDFYNKNQVFIESVHQFSNNKPLVKFIGFLESMQNKIKRLAPKISNLRDGKLNNHELLTEIASKNQEIADDIDFIQKESQNIVDAFLESSQLYERSQRLYWAVIAMGLFGFVLVLLNVDKLRQLSKNNNEKMKYLALLESRLVALEAAHDGIVIIDHNENITFVNKAMCVMLGIDEDRQSQSIGGKWLSLFSEDQVEIIQEDILPEIEENGYWIGELPLYHDDGGIVYTDFSISCVQGGGMIITAMDVTEKHKVEAEKKQIEDQFYQAQKMEAVGRLAGGIAHDFNNILSAMNGYAEFLVDDLPKNSEQQKFALNIIQAGKQAKSLVEQILAFSRRSDSSKNAINVIETVQEVATMLSATFPRTLEIKTSVNVDSAYMMGGANQISQVLMNLCVNARDAMDDDRGALIIGADFYTADDGFCIHDAVRDEFPDEKQVPFLRIEDVQPTQTHLIVGHFKRGQKYIKISIGDTGTGIARVVMEHMFEPFFTTKSVDKGTGLGLAMVHGVMVDYHGVLFIDSIIGKGTRFDLFFPVVNYSNRVERIGDEDSVRQTNAQRLKILLVEDQEYVLDMMRRLLERLGHEVAVCADGVEALLYLKTQGHEVDLVITDQNMPRMTGIEMIEQVYIDRPEIKFLVISGYSEKQMQEMIERHPAIKGVLKKPVSKEEIQTNIERIVLDGHVQNKEQKKYAS